MTRRSRRKKPGRIKPPRQRGQGRQKLRKAIQELYPPHGATDGDDGPPAIEELEKVLGDDVAPPPSRPKRPAAERPPDAATRDGAPAGSADLRRGRVLAPASGACRVESDGRTFYCTLPSHLALDQQRRLAAGDDVLFAPHGQDFRVHEVLPRRTTLSRPDPMHPHREKVLAANVDVVVQVASIRQPPLRPALIDRCLIAIERGGARPLLCVNKIDLARAPHELRRCLEEVEPYRELGVEVIPCSAQTGEGIDAIRTRLAGTTAVLVGHSGVGKSSLLNALDPTLDVRTGDVDDRDGRGRHTTTRSRLYRLAGDVQMIDTPGIREFGLFELDPDELSAYFPEFEPYAVACRFNDCRHDHEPNCAVRDAAENGEIAPARYATYLRILESLVDS